ncbi:hypothetical protein LGH70_09835 [Hymenobacter sp. BT635]|uniref:Uncharacterized protein n=1 Tax=Hymenobacter nitidus TaxID=2880929 RepID=A0ABS8ABY0_9BACT|nr:hypothetical protein [Hymenobacter nitidus]MCB2377882.1 hypothetical protein [Hymenobacter nitidus]
MLLYPARRHRRPLLFPPGLLALGFLLLLGCQVLRPWYRQLKPRYVLQLTVPPKPVSDYILPQYEEGEKFAKLNGFTPTTNEYLHRYSQLAYYRPWQDFAFTGISEQDAAIAREAQQALRAMQADTLHAQGVRIRFGEQATYAGLIRVLDLASAIERQMLDLHHEPATFYAFTDAYKPPSNGIMLECGTDYYDVIDRKPAASFEAQMQNWLTRWQLTWQEAFSSSWQPPILFLLGIIAVSSWKMARRWHTA